VFLSPLAIQEMKRIITESDIVKEDDNNWPKKNVVGKQELEIRIGTDHISFETAKIGSLVDVQSSEDPEGLRVFYYLIQDLRVRWPLDGHHQAHACARSSCSHCEALWTRSVVANWCLQSGASLPHQAYASHGSSLHADSIYAATH
jgi:hypothetical protein